LTTASSGLATFICLSNEGAALEGCQICSGDLAIAVSAKKAPLRERGSGYCWGRYAVQINVNLVAQFRARTVQDKLEPERNPELSVLFACAIPRAFG
jgi:hypothetical protein